MVLRSILAAFYLAQASHTTPPLNHTNSNEITLEPNNVERLGELQKSIPASVFSQLTENKTPDQVINVVDIHRSNQELLAQMTKPLPKMPDI